MQRYNIQEFCNVPSLYVQLVQKKLRQALTRVLVLLLRRKNTYLAEKVYKDGEWIQLIKDGTCLCAVMKKMKFLTRLLDTTFSMKTLLQGRKVCDKCSKCNQIKNTHFSQTAQRLYPLTTSLLHYSAFIYG